MVDGKNWDICMYIKRFGGYRYIESVISADTLAYAIFQCPFKSISIPLVKILGIDLCAYVDHDFE